MNRYRDPGRAIVCSAMFLFILAGLACPGFAQVVFQEGFETGWGSWSAGNGVWEIGTPTSGPNGCHSGSNCAATVLGGNYPQYTGSRLESASIQLPTVTGGQEIHLRFWHWFSYGNGNGQVQVSVYNGSSWATSSWTSIGTAAGVNSAVWSVRDIDLAAFAGSLVKIGFLHNGGSVVGPGWYIDDIQLIKAIPVFTGDFESGLADWSASNGVWQVGTPTSGPNDCHSGSYCAATVLDGNYPQYNGSRLESAPIQLPTVTGADEIHLRFWHWFSYGNGNGQVQVSVYDGSSWVTSTWTNAGTAVGGNSGVWSIKDVDLTPYSGLLVKIGFLHNGGSVVGPGWYIDDISITPPPAGGPYDFDGDDKTDIGVYRPSTGVWYILTSGTPGAYTATQWGVLAQDDIAVPGNYGSDRAVDIAVWRPGTGVWYILPSNDPGNYTVIQWGLSTDKPFPADYDGDGKDDITVYRPGTGVWYILPSGSPGTYTATQWGSPADLPVPGDYDGDNSADVSVYRPSTGVWYILPSGALGTYIATQWGSPADLPVPGDYDGDGTTDIGVWRPSDGTWYILLSGSPGTYSSTHWGIAADVPLPLPTWLRNVTLTP